MLRVPVLSVLLISLAAASRTFAAEPPAAPPRANLATENFVATLDRIDSDGNITFRVGDKLRVVSTRELAWWGRYRDVATGPQIILADGSVLRADLLKLADESLVIGDATGLGRGLWSQSTLPRSAPRAILWQPPAGSADRDALVHRLLSEAAKTDHLLLVGGEALAGSLIAAPLDGPFLPEGSTPGQAAFTWQSRGQAEPLAVPASKVRAIQFVVLPPTAPAGRPTLWIGCRDGSLFQVSSLASQGDKLVLRLAAGGELTTTLAHRSEPDTTFWKDVTWLHSSGGDAVWLSDQKTLGYKHIPFLSIEWPYAADGSVTGGRLRAAGGIFPKGLGMHSTSRLAYDVAGYRKFEAELALDETAGRRGSVIYKVLLYGAGGKNGAVGNALRGVPGASVDSAPTWTTAYESPILRGGEAPVPVSIDLKGAARLALIVEFADRGDELDYANWLQARLIK